MIRSNAQAGDTLSIHCVFLTCFDADFNFVSDLLRSAGIRLHLADTLEWADFLLTVTGATVLLSDALFLDGSWRDAAAMLAHLHRGVWLVLVAPEGEQIGRTEALDQGVCEMIARPLRIGAMRKAIQTADEVVWHTPEMP